MSLNFPQNPTTGQVYTYNNESWTWNGTAWIVSAGAKTYAPVHISATPPRVAIAGDLWFDKNNGFLYVYYTDIDSSQWISATQQREPIVDVPAKTTVDNLLEVLTPYADITTAVASGTPTGALFKVTGSTDVAGIRSVSSYGGGAGSKGDKGQTGDKGEAGTNGTNGTDGTKGQKGEVGVTGTAGAKGAAGTNGTAGTKGEKGAAGVDGTNGTNGSDGTKGQKGQDGAGGTNGTDGTKGQKGELGTNGTDGTKGQKGSDGSGTPSGANTEIQFNDNGSFGSNANLTYNSSLNVLQALSATVIQLGAGTLSVTGNTTLGDASTDTITLTGEIASHYIPTTDATYDLGDASHKIRHLFLSSNSLYMGSSLQLGASAGDNLTVNAGIETVGSILPTVNNAADLGSSALKWNNGYFNLLHAGNYAFPTVNGSSGQILASNGTNVTFQDGFGVQSDWVATLTGLTGQPGSPITQTGKYVRNGNVIIASVENLNFDSTGYSGQFGISGLPVAANSAVGGNGVIRQAGLLDPANTEGLIVMVAAGATTAKVYSQTSGIAANWDSTTGTGRNFNLTITYIV